MPTSAICRRAEARAGGFTLLEMIVVLAILGLAASVVAPAMLRGIETWRRATQIDALTDQLRALPGVARARGKAIVISQATLDGPDPPLQVGAGLRLRVAEPWTVRASGICEGGRVEVGNDAGSRTLVTTPPFCTPSLE